MTVGQKEADMVNERENLADSFFKSGSIFNSIYANAVKQHILAL